MFDTCFYVYSASLTYSYQRHSLGMQKVYTPSEGSFIPLNAKRVFGDL